MALDRGSKSFFYGRKEELEQFKSFLNLVKKDNSRTTFLIQGAPGVGKTTLWEYCCGLAEKQGWNIVLIDRSTLYNIKDFRKRLGREPIWKFWRKSKIPITPNIGELSLGMEMEINHHTFLKTLNAVKTPTILALDEAQKLGSKDLSPAKKSSVGDVLDHLHNRRGKNKSSLVLLMNGLGRTKEILKEYGISRFATKAVINLSEIDKMSERKIIHDWLVIEAGVNKDDLQLNHWIGQISQQTHQWPQHIAAYGAAAVDYFQKNEKKLTDKGLNVILEKGMVSRQDYYRDRLDGFKHSECEIIIEFLKTQKDMKYFSDKDIVPFFEKTLSPKKSEKLFQKAWYSGIFHQGIDMKYSISVPSMKYWFIYNLGSKK